MSLNRCEQRLLDYIRSHSEEGHYWFQKVQSIVGKASDAAGAEPLERELWRYYQERSAVVPVFKDAAKTEGLGRTSLRNLAELLLRTKNSGRRSFDI